VSEVPLDARVRLLVKSLTPPLLWGVLKSARARGVRSANEVEPAPEPSPPPVAEPPPEWEYVPEGWSRAATDERVKGWDVDAIAEAYRAKWPSYLEALRGPGPLGVYHEVVAGETVASLDHGAHTMLVSYAYVLALTAREKQRVSILDWGGGSGHYLPLSRAVLPDVEIDYSCKDVPALVSLGRELFPEARFLEDDDEALSRPYDLVLASGSLQYSESWPDTLARLGEAAGSYLYVTRLPVALEEPSFVVLQRAYAYGYDTEYLGWVVNREELLREAAAARLELVREFLLQAWFTARGAPEQPVEHRGFLFRRIRT